MALRGGHRDGSAPGVWFIYLSEVGAGFAGEAGPLHLLGRVHLVVPTGLRWTVEEIMLVFFLDVGVNV